jgi:bisphosphoglycerate-dependent phosphoglycerate mutase
MNEEAITDETPQEKAWRLTESLRGLLKEEFAEFGGAEGFLRMVRGYDEEPPENDQPAREDPPA